MGFLAPALPWITTGLSALGGIIGGKKAQSSAMARTPEEQQALSGAQGAAGQLLTQGQGLFGQGQQALGSGLGTMGTAANYWNTLLRGNRAAMSQAVAAPTAALTDQYRGAERSLERSGVRGGVADLAKAELSRQRAGQIAGLTTGIQPTAAGNLADIGGRIGSLGLGAAQSGMQGAGQAGNIWSNLLSQGAANRQYGQQVGANTGSSIGGLLFDVLNGTLGKLGQKKGIPGLPGGTSGPF